MLLTLVDKDTYTFEDSNSSVIVEMESDHLPAVGDMIKDGHTLSAFKVYRVEERVFRSKPSKPARADGKSEMVRVLLLVSRVTSR